MMRALDGLAPRAPAGRAPIACAWCGRLARVPALASLPRVGQLLLPSRFRLVLEVFVGRCASGLSAILVRLSSLTVLIRH